MEAFEKIFHLSALLSVIFHYGCILVFASAEQFSAHTNF